MKKKKIIIVSIFSLLVVLLITMLYNTKENKMVEKDGIMFALTVDGEKRTDFPKREDGNYKVAIECENGTGKWLYDEWKFAVEDITGNVKCFIDFTTTTENDYLNNYVMSLEGTEQGTGKVVHETDSADFSGYVAGDILGTDDYLEVTNDATYAYTWDETNLKWSSTNTTAATTSTIEFKVSEAGNYRFCRFIPKGSTSNKITFYVDDTSIISSSPWSASYDVTGCLSTNIALTTDNVVKVTYYAAIASSVTTFYLQKYPYVEDIREFDVGYRYQGTNPNNYVSFNNELWRIIGVDDVTLSDGTTVKNLTKIVKANTIGLFSGASGSWPNSSLYKQLHFYYNSENGNGSDCKLFGTYTASTCDFRGRGIQSEYKNMIENVTWNLGYSTYTNPAGKHYCLERSDTVYSSGYAATTTGYIGLIYPSDYGYSLSSEDFPRSSALSSVKIKSWMMYNNAWAGISGCPFAMHETSYSGYEINTDRTSSNSNFVFPSLYLKENVFISSGSGTTADPYILGM